MGYLLLKNPARVHSFDVAFGRAHVFYPELSDAKSTACLLIDIDPVGLVRGRSKNAGEGTLDQYVNDRPYVSSSFLSVAMSRIFGTAMGGRSKERQELADTPLDWTAVIAVAPCRAGDTFIRGLFDPLGYAVNTKRHPLDERFPEWGDGVYYTITINGKKRLQDLLTHIYVLVPVLDSDKHYWVGDDEVEKLLRKGEGWLAAHPQREVIASRYLRHDWRLTRDALARLADEDAPDPEAIEQEHTSQELEIEASIRLWEQRLGCVISALRALDAKTVVDLGCGEGKLLRYLLQDKRFERLMGVDVSWRNLEKARRRLSMDTMPDVQRKRIDLILGSLMYRDARLEGFDAATVVEVVEHLDPPRLAAFERVLFECARPKAAIITTPNSEYNVRFETLPAGQFRHRDHRFEWSRQEFSQWAHRITERFGYSVRFLPIGPEDPVTGAPTQMGIF